MIRMSEEQFDYYEGKAEECRRLRAELDVATIKLEGAGKLVQLLRDAQDYYVSHCEECLSRRHNGVDCDCGYSEWFAQVNLAIEWPKEETA